MELSRIRRCEYIIIRLIANGQFLQTNSTDRYKIINIRPSFSISNPTPRRNNLQRFKQASSNTYMYNVTYILCKCNWHTHTYMYIIRMHNFIQCHVDIHNVHVLVHVCVHLLALSNRWHDYRPSMPGAHKGEAYAVGKIHIGKGHIHEHTHTHTQRKAHRHTQCRTHTHRGIQACTHHLCMAIC